MPGVLVIAALLVTWVLAQVPADTCRELVLHNGRITTLDARGTSATSIVIRDDRIASVSTAAGVPPHGACARVIDLRGRRVIPGMIDTHDHPSYFTARPGFDVRLDTAASIADVQARIRTRASGVKPGEWVTSLGGCTCMRSSPGRTTREG